jgi:hypothetical protein
MSGKKITIDEEGISEIQVRRLAILKTIWRRKKKKRINNNSNPQQKSKHRLQQVADYHPGDHLKEGTQIFILLSVQQKV